MTRRTSCTRVPGDGVQLQHGGGVGPAERPVEGASGGDADAGGVQGDAGGLQDDADAFEGAAGAPSGGADRQRHRAPPEELVGAVPTQRPAAAQAPRPGPHPIPRWLRKD